MNLSPRAFSIPGRWCVHGYYTLCPYAPDGSGRILAAGGNLEEGWGEVLVLSPDGEVLDTFGRHALTNSFYHTGWWQTWSPDSKSVYFQAGTLREPRIGRRHLASGEETYVDGDMEGAPPDGDPILSGLMGMLYAAGYGGSARVRKMAPVPFQARDRHGIFEESMDPSRRVLRLTVNDILERLPSPHRERVIDADEDYKRRFGPEEGLTLMAYCVRWAPGASRLLFFFGNHCVVKERDEPRLGYVITSDRSLEEMHLAVDMSFGRKGVHWSWQPDGEHLIGYGCYPDNPHRQCLAEVRYDGTGYRVLSDHASGGHPSVSPADPDLVVTDEGTRDGGAVVFISKRTGTEVGRVPLGKFIGNHETPGRNPLRVCHHPVFNRTGDRVLCNSLPGKHATLVEIGL